MLDLIDGRGTIGEAAIKVIPRVFARLKHHSETGGKVTPDLLRKIWVSTGEVLSVAPLEAILQPVNDLLMTMHRSSELVRFRLDLPNHTLTLARPLND